MAGPLCTGLVEVWVQFQASKREDWWQFGLPENGEEERVNYVMGSKSL